MNTKHQTFEWKCTFNTFF